MVALGESREYRLDTEEISSLVARNTHDVLASDVLSLWVCKLPGWDETGMIMQTDLQSDVYTLSMTYDHRRVRPEHLDAVTSGSSPRMPMATGSTL